MKILTQLVTGGSKKSATKTLIGTFNLANDGTRGRFRAWAQHF